MAKRLKRLVNLGIFGSAPCTAPAAAAVACVPLRVDRLHRKPRLALAVAARSTGLLIAQLVPRGIVVGGAGCDFGELRLWAEDCCELIMTRGDIVDNVPDVVSKRFLLGNPIIGNRNNFQIRYKS